MVITASSYTYHYENSFFEYIKHLPEPILGLNTQWSAAISLDFILGLQLTIEIIVLVQYKNVKADYLKNIWKVINWKYASEVYEKESPCLRQ